MRVKSLKSRTKYGAVRTSCGDHVHASKKEAVRCGELQCLLKGKLIRDLVQQPRFELRVYPHDDPGGVPVVAGTYVADFEYWEFDNGAWARVVEDVKGIKTPVYNLKKKLVKSIYGIEIRETR